MALSMYTIQIEQALFEIHNAVVGNRRAIDRLVAGLVVGSPVGMSGPRGVGKSHIIGVVARVFGLEVIQVADPTELGVPDERHLYAVEMEPAFNSQSLIDSLSKTTEANLVVSASAADWATVSSGLRDSLLSFIEVPYPTAAEEAVLALDASQPTSVDRILHGGDLSGLRSQALGMHVPDAVVGYAVRLVQASRMPAQHGLTNLVPLLAGGASPRASIGLVRAARGLALIAGRSEATVQDVYDAAYEVLIHRVELSPHAAQTGISPADVVVELLSRVSARRA